MLNPVTIGIAVGYGFLLGVPLLLWGFWSGKDAVDPKKRRRRAVLVWVLFLFLPLTTPVPVWLHAAWGIVLLLAMLRVKGSRCWGIAFVVLTVVVWCDEVRHHLWWPLRGKEYSRLVLIGDSLTAGMGFGGEVIWPVRLKQNTGWDVVDLSEAGSTVKLAQNQAARIPVGEGLVLVEIGGNDMLEVGDVGAFEKGLDELLEMIRGPGREVVMFELPLPPLCQRFGEVQRRLARKYGVRLLPKRYFGGLLMPAGATEDGLHFSNEGHERVAKFVEELVGGVMVKATVAAFAPSVESIKMDHSALLITLGVKLDDSCQAEYACEKSPESEQRKNDGGADLAAEPVADCDDDVRSTNSAASSFPGSVVSIDILGTPDDH